MSYFRIIGFCITGLIATVILKRQKDDYGTVLSLFLTVTLTICAIGILEPCIAYLKYLGKGSSVSEYLTLIFKSCGIGLITSISSDICKDCGESALGNKIELCGKCLLISLSLPLLKQVFEETAKILG